MRLLSYQDSGFEKFAKSLNRKAVPTTELRERVADIISQVEKQGDRCLKELTERFDGYQFKRGESLLATEEEIQEATKLTKPATKKAIRESLKNIRDFAKKSSRKNWSSKNAQGATVGERFVPYDRVGVYVPGGKAPLVSTALMTAGFAKAIGVPQIVAATPVGADGKINPALLYALKAAGATEILKVGGAHAVAALALGTKTIIPVEKIVGPGNAFVVEAKRQLVGAVSIDLIPGPSEVLVVSDASGRADYIAADLLAQAEHGPDSEVGFFTTSKRLFKAVEKEIAQQAQMLSRGETIAKVLKDSAFALHVKDMQQAIDLCNDYAPEHLLLVSNEEKKWLPKVKTAGAIYLGNDSAIAVGDFLAGPSHTLPTGGAGKSFSGLRADQFQRRTSIVRLDQKSINRSLETVEEFARVEGLDAHGHSVKIRSLS